MSNYVISPQAIVGLPVVGEAGLFPVRRVYCVGRNYAAHAREMGFDPDREPPFFFCKPNDDKSVVVVPEGETVTIPYPDLTSNYHYELELVVCIPARPADQDARSRPSMGNRQGLRLFRAGRPGVSGLPRWPCE
jgi:fumarylpyruvate hydrolase